MICPKCGKELLIPLKNRGEFYYFCNVCNEYIKEVSK